MEHAAVSQITSHVFARQNLKDIIVKVGLDFFGSSTITIKLSLRTIYSVISLPLNVGISLLK